jgi:tyrosyl-tRNA synthetase
MNQIEETLTRRVEKVLPSKNALEKLLRSGKKIKLYQGFDPTGYRLHLGHTVGMRKLMDFAKLGHEVIFLFGTGTVLVGDPSERVTGRKLITQKEIDQNITTWKKQANPIVDFNKVTIKQNGDWLVPLTLKEIINIASKISAVQLFKRESFQRRLKRGETIWYHETMYPLLQGYDSVVMDVDLEIGGTDQEFNMLIGRELQRKMNNREKFVLTTPMIVGIDGQQMSKTSHNCVWLDDMPKDMFGKLMRLPDEHITSYLELLTDISQTEINHLPNDPLANKKRLAFDITRQFHGEAKAKAAQAHFETTIQQGQAPDEIELISLKPGQHTLLKICQQAGVGESNAQIKRTITQGGVELNGKKITNPLEPLNITGGEILKFGKREFRKIK